MTNTKVCDKIAKLFETNKKFKQFEQFKKFEKLKKKRLTNEMSCGKINKLFERTEHIEKNLKTLKKVLDKLKTM